MFKWSVTLNLTLFAYIRSVMCYNRETCFRPFMLYRPQFSLLTPMLFHSLLQNIYSLTYSSNCNIEVLSQLNCILSASVSYQFTYSNMTLHTVCSESNLHFCNLFWEILVIAGLDKKLMITSKQWRSLRSIQLHGNIPGNNMQTVNK